MSTSTGSGVLQSKDPPQEDFAKVELFRLEKRTLENAATLTPFNLFFSHLEV